MRAVWSAGAASNLLGDPARGRHVRSLRGAGNGHPASLGDAHRATLTAERFIEVREEAAEALGWAGGGVLGDDA